MPAARRRSCSRPREATFLGGINGRTAAPGRLVVCALGLRFGLAIYRQLKNMQSPSMLEVSELIYETCKTYLQTQGRFLLVLWVFIGIAVFQKPQYLSRKFPAVMRLPFIQRKFQTNYRQPRNHRKEPTLGYVPFGH